eukprot:1408341-Lingulodinium_polyedra.AAC.1
MSRQEALRRYRTRLLDSPEFLADLAGLAGHTLICHCEPGVGCHADVLVQLFDQVVASPASGQPLSNWAEYRFRVGVLWAVD